MLGISAIRGKYGHISQAIGYGRTNTHGHCTRTVHDDLRFDDDGIADTGTMLNASVDARISGRRDLDDEHAAMLVRVPRQRSPVQTEPRAPCVRVVNVAVEHRSAAAAGHVRQHLVVDVGPTVAAVIAVARRRAAVVMAVVMAVAKAVVMAIGRRSSVAFAIGLRSAAVVARSAVLVISSRSSVGVWIRLVVVFIAVVACGWNPG